MAQSVMVLCSADVDVVALAGVAYREWVRRVRCEDECASAAGLETLDEIT
jgi:hypothetical protein